MILYSQYANGSKFIYTDTEHPTQCERCLTFTDNEELKRNFTGWFSKPAWVTATEEFNMLFSEEEEDWEVRETT